MKKKILSALLAVTLFAGMAIPAFASNVSSLAGDSSDVDKIVFTATSYSVKQNDSLKIINDEHPDRSIVKGFVGKNTFVPDADFDFEIDCPDGSFALSDNVVYALEKSGTATLKAISSDNEDITATTKLVATAGLKDDSLDAKGYQFDDKVYEIPYAAEGTAATHSTTPAAFSFKILPTPSGSYFTQTQFEEIKNLVGGKIAEVLQLNLNDDFIFEDEDSGKDIKVTVKPENRTSDKFDTFDEDEKIEVNVSIEDFKEEGKTASARCYFLPKAGKVARNVSVPSTLDLQVGDYYDLDANLKPIPSTANILFKDTNKGTKGVVYDEDYINDDAENDDYAIVDDAGLITAVAVGKNKIVTSYTYFDAEDKAVTTDATTVVNVLPLGSKVSSDASITPTTAAVKVGEKLTITAKNTGSAEVTWSVSNGKLATVTVKGTSTTLKALKAGTVTVTAKVGSKVIGTSKVTITSASSNNGGNGGTTVTPPPTKNPQTGDSFFSNLF